MVQDLALPTEPQDQGNLDLAPQDSEFTGEADFRHSFILTINGINYPATAWETVDAARFVEKRYDQGFNGGMGAFLESQATRPGQIYTCVNIDPSTFPYIRMRKGERDETALTLTGGDIDKPAYGFMEEDPGNREYLYIVNDDRSFKIDLGANGTGTPALEGTTQPSNGSGSFASGVVGRPVRFEGAWYVPLGAGTNALKLTATAEGDQVGDTWTDVGVTALHFAHMMTEVDGLGVARLWRAHSTNLVDASADAITFGGDSEVGDSSYPITDLLSVAGELFVSKPDRPYRFDDQGNSVPVLEFVNATSAFLTNFQGFDGANSGAFGPYAYWAHSTGLWRIIGDSAITIDPFSEPNWSGIGLDSLTPSFNTGWFSFAAWGRWAYATNASDGVYAGRIQSDGTVTWLGCILSSAGTAWSAKARCGIVSTSTNPILWVLDASMRFAVFDLETDGSMRGIKATGGAGTDRGGDNEQGQIWLPNTDLGEPEKRKQIRLMAFTVDNNAYANLDIEARIHRDRNATSVQLGSALTSASADGRFEFAPASNSVNITSSSTANPTVITTSSAHGFQSQDTITIAGHSSTPDINGVHTITWLSTTTFSIPVNVTAGGGAAGTVTGNRDEFIEGMPAIRFDTNQAGAFAPGPADPRIRSAIFRAAMPHVYRATMPLDANGLRGYSVGVKDALEKLRNLKSAGAVAVREPAFNHTFTGYILDVQERARVSAGGRVDYVAEVLIQRWVL